MGNLIDAVLFKYSVPEKHPHDRPWVWTRGRSGSARSGFMNSGLQT